MAFTTQTARAPIRPSPLQGEVRWGSLRSRQNPPPSPSRAPLAAAIKDLETPREAATNLEFEQAKLRDAVKRLREIELATLTGEVNDHPTRAPPPNLPLKGEEPHRGLHHRTARAPIRPSPFQGEVRWGSLRSRQTPPTSPSRATLAAAIKDLETPLEAATNLEFEKARLRDAVKRLRDIELATLTGEVNDHPTRAPPPNLPLKGQEPHRGRHHPNRARPNPSLPLPGGG
ncbi:hypothetical protein SAMN02745223_03236 [Devosia limi DSM 17137]|uniref:UVR domain-containing protein n=1 Tax=Devosia limi DSM 17137 TaxID=1121477 RepID=A0A1M5DH30_9HYPH|nr:hypothetical protein SAMN02745223_03236 [Devosia limi DSM 17137]